MEDSNEGSCVDKYDEIFNAVLSKTESEFYSSPICKDGTGKTSKKKRQLEMKKDQSSTKRMKNLKETTKDRLLELNNFYANQKFGIWVQCTKCNKWRKVLEYEEEHEVPQDWCCSMSISGIKSCDAPENEEDKDFSPANFVPGSIVWAKVEGYPWWPGMVEDDPDLEEFYWEYENGRSEYHVTFLDDKVTHAWVPSAFICSFLKPPRNRQLYSRTMQSKYSHLIENAKKKANEAIHMPIKERLQHFSFAHRYTGKWPRAIDIGNNEDTEDITEMLIQEVDDVESVNSSDSDYNSISSPELNKNKSNVLDNDVSIILDSKIDKKQKIKKRSTIIATENTTANNTAITSQNEEPKATKLLKKFINTAEDLVTNTDPQIPKNTSETLAMPLEEKKIDNSLRKNELLSETTKLNQCVKKPKTKKNLVSPKVKNCTTDKQLNQNLEDHKNVNSDENITENIPRKSNRDLKITNIIQNSNNKKKSEQSVCIKSANKKFKPPTKNNEKSSECKETSKKTQKKIILQSNNFNDSNSNMKKKENTYKENIGSNSSTQLKLSDKTEQMVDDKMKENVSEQLLKCKTDTKVKELAKVNSNYMRESKSDINNENNENLKMKKEKKIKSTKEILKVLEKNFVASTINHFAIKSGTNNVDDKSEEIHLVKDSECDVNEDIKNQADTDAQNIVNTAKHEDPSKTEDKKRKELEILGKNTKPSKKTKQKSQMNENVSGFSLTTCETEGKKNRMKNCKLMSDDIQNKKKHKENNREETNQIFLSDENVNAEKLSQEKNCNNYFSVSISEDMQQTDDDSDPFEA